MKADIADSSEFEAFLRHVINEWVWCWYPAVLYFLSCKRIDSTLTDTSHYFLYRHHRAANTLITNLPEMRKILLEALDLVFIPKQIASQVVLAVALESSMVCMYYFHFIRHLVFAELCSAHCIISYLGYNKPNMANIPKNRGQRLDALASYPSTTQSTTRGRKSGRVDGFGRTNW